MRCKLSKDLVLHSMTFEQLEHLTLQMQQAFDESDFVKINEIVLANQEGISRLSATSDENFNAALKSFIELYLSIQSYCQNELKVASTDLKKINKARKGLKQYSKASKRA